MNTPKIPVLIDRADYEVCAAAARLARRASGKDMPDTETLIAFQFKLRTPEALAKDYLECTGEHEARFNVRETTACRPPSNPRKPGNAVSVVKRPSPRPSKTGRGIDALRSARKPTDLSRN